MSCVLSFVANKKRILREVKFTASSIIFWLFILNIEIKKQDYLHILERALENDVDLDRLKSLLELREKEIERQERKNFVRDLSTMQMEYQKIHKNATNTHTNSQYAMFDKYLDAIKDSLSKYRFALFSRIKEQNSNDITVKMSLKHISGNEISIPKNISF